jgi:ABC-type dipeptide/oligopeptide/nickel transport system ATPase subunit
MDFQTLQLPIPEKISSYDIELQRDIYNYLQQMNDKERIAYRIATDHLGTSFNIVKSIGFIQWKKVN